MNTEQMFDFLDANGRQDIIDYIQLLSDKISVLERENKIFRQARGEPLRQEKIERLREYHGINDWMYETSVVDFVRDVEKAHGIQ